MAVAWKVLWERDNPYNAVFHEVGAFDLLVLLDVTYQVPTSMQKDAAFMDEWTNACKGMCFTIWGDPDNPAQQKAVLIQLHMNNDLLNHFEGKPEAKPIFDLMMNAQYDMVW